MSSDYKSKNKISIFSYNRGFTIEKLLVYPIRFPYLVLKCIAISCAMNCTVMRNSDCSMQWSAHCTLRRYLNTIYRLFSNTMSCINSSCFRNQARVHKYHNYLVLFLAEVRFHQGLFSAVHSFGTMVVYKSDLTQTPLRSKNVLFHPKILLAPAGK